MTDAKHEAPASPAWRDEYNRVEAIREAAEGQDRIARNAADPITRSDAETQAAGHWTRYEREVAKLNATPTRHEAPAEGAGEDAAWMWLNGHVECDPADRDYSADEMVDAFMAGQSAALRARSSAPEA